MNKAQLIEALATVAMKAWEIGRAAGLSDETIVDGIRSAFERIGIKHAHALLMAEIAKGDDCQGWLCALGDERARCARQAERRY